VALIRFLSSLLLGVVEVATEAIMALLAVPAVAVVLWLVLGLFYRVTMAV
jgi:hypothetical protein